MIALTITAQSALARNDIGEYNIQNALNEGKEKGVLQDDIKLYFGSQYVSVSKKMGEYKTNKKTNGFNKSDEAACNWAFLSAVKSLQDRARREGGTKVINIKSNYQNKEFASTSKFQCGAGAFLVGVALKGTVAK